MDENTGKAIFTLMQKVVDKLDVLTETVSKENNTELSNIISQENDKLKDLAEKTISNQSIIEQKILTKKEIIDSIKENTETPVTNNYTEYSLFGSKSHFKPWIIGVFFFSLVTVWCSIKYLPSYFTERSLLSKEREEYELFYNYVYLKQFKEDEINIASETLKMIKKKDTLLFKEYHTLLNAYKREIRKQELKEELNSLDNDR